MTLEECLETGELGFYVHGTPRTHGMFTGTSGVLVAHDLIEHVNGLGMIGSVGDELMALGAIWKVRGQWGDVVRGEVGSALSSEQHIAGEIPELYGHFHRGVPMRMEAPPTEGEKFLYEVWDAIADEAIKMVRGDWTTDDEYSFETWEEFLSLGRHLFVAGGVKLEEIWGTNALAANSQFWSIHDEVEGHLQEGFYVEGQEFHLCYGEGDACIVPAEEDDL